MSLGSRGPVVIDTGVFGARLTPSGRLLAALYRPMLEGRPAVISFVTVAELEFGARLADWGPTGSGGWNTRWAGPRSSGLEPISPTCMPRCVPGASGQGTAWARRNMRRILGGGDSAVASGSFGRPRSDLRQRQQPRATDEARRVGDSAAAIKGQ